MRISSSIASAKNALSLSGEKLSKGSTATDLSGMAVVTAAHWSVAALGGCAHHQTTAGERATDFLAAYNDAIDHFCHGFMRYHPPRQPWVGEEDFEECSSVVATAYDLHDQMLGTILALARAKAGGEPTGRWTMEEADRP